MTIVAIDDERPARMMLLSAIEEVEPGAQVVGFDDPDELIEYARENHIDIACLDIQIYDVSGVDIARQLQEIQKDINIIFVTAYEGYMPEAFKLHASGYVTKPVDVEALREEFKNLRHDLDKHKDVLMKIVCFGNFEVFDKEGNIIKFSRSRAKEAFAYLVSLNGSSCTIGELSAVLFGDDCGEEKNKSYLQKILSSMNKDLTKAGVSEVLRKSFNSIAIDTGKVDCDFYRYKQGDEEALDAYMGEFMNQYSWAEEIM